MAETVAKESKIKIEPIPGHTNILLIAPHGVEAEPYDDIGTAELTHQIKKHIGCQEIVNTTYRKPTGNKPQKRNGGKPSVKKKVLNLNLVTQASKHPNFLDEIREKVDTEGLTYIFWIHGIADKNIKKGVDCFIGYGQPGSKQETRYTAKQATKDKVLKSLNDNGIKTVLAPQTSKYRGWSKRYMNQWFLLNKYKFDQVQSIQLEFKFSSIRKNEKIETSAQKIATAISALIEPVPETSPADNENIDDLKLDLEEEQIIEEIPKDTDTEIVEENPKVEEAYQYLKGIFIKHISKAMLEAGQYLIKQFYGGLYKEAEKNPLTHNKSLNQLFDKLQNETSGNAPKKSWLYNSIHLAIAEENYTKVSIYGKMGHSHKVLISNVKEKLPEDTKKKLMEKTVDKGWTVLQLQEEINKKKNTDNISLREAIPIELLEDFDTKELKSFKKRTQTLETKTQEALTIYQGNLKKFDKALINRPQIISVSRRTDIPAFYSDWFFNRVKEGFVLRKKYVGTKKAERISLLPEDVRCFVFWTKNPGPMINKLHLLDEQGYKYYFQFTLTPYGKDIEKKVPSKQKLIETFKRLSEKIGKDRIIWRYDPILIKDTIDIEYHRKHFADLAEKLHKYTERCVISFVDYKQISAASKKELNLFEIDINGETIKHDVMRGIATEFQKINRKFDLEIQTCAEPIDLTEFGITKTKCIDDKVISHITGEKIVIGKDKGQRDECGCLTSEEIGTHGTCIYGCTFCYATKNQKKAESNFRQHDKKSPLLIGQMPDDGKKKKVTGFQEWTKSKNNVNICTGCSNDCKYCYAKSMAYRFKQVQEGQWAEQIIREQDVNKNRKLYDGRVGFPTSHDITPTNIDAYLKVLKKLLEVGNKILIVSKPNLECIKQICEVGSAYQNKILFRFTIGAMNDDILKFWDTNAPLYKERKESLMYAFDNRFQTSVSMEPLLEASSVIEMTTDLVNHVSDFIWIGKMNHTAKLKTQATKNADTTMLEQIETIEKGQTEDKIKAIYADFQKEPELLKKIKWKDSYKKVLGIESAKEAGMDV